VRREGETLLRLIAAGKAQPASSWPATLPPPLPREARTVYDRLKDVATLVGKQHGVPVEVLLRKRQLEALVLSVVDHGFDVAPPVALNGWRGQILTPLLFDALREHAGDLQAWRELRQRGQQE